MHGRYLRGCGANAACSTDFIFYAAHAAGFVAGHGNARFQCSRSRIGFVSFQLAAGGGTDADV